MTMRNGFALSRAEMIRTLTAHSGITSADGNVGGTTLFDANLIGSNDFVTSKTILIQSGNSNNEDKAAIAFNPATGEITVDTAFTGQILAGTIYKILNISTVELDVINILARIGTNVDAPGTTTLFAWLARIWGGLLSNQGLIYAGTVTAAAAPAFTIASLAGLGAGKFSDVQGRYWAYVARDAGGAGGAPQGEIRQITAYNTATGEFTAGAFSVPVAVNDDIIILHPSIALAGIESVDAVYFDEIAGVGGTGDEVGTPQNPVNNVADAVTILGARNLSKLVLSGTGAHAITLPNGFDYEIVGNPNYAVTVVAGGVVNVASDISCSIINNTNGFLQVMGDVFASGAVSINQSGAGMIIIQGHVYGSQIVNSAGGSVDIRDGADLPFGIANAGGGSVNITGGVKIQSGQFGTNGAANVDIYGDSEIQHILHASTGHFNVHGKLLSTTGVFATAAGGTINVYDEATVQEVGSTIAGAVITFHARCRCYGPINQTGTVNFWSEYGDTVYFDDSVGVAGTDFPIGTANRPCNSAANVLTICQREHIYKIRINGTFTISATMETYEFAGNPARDVIDFNGQDVDSSRFKGLRFIGAQAGTGYIFAEECILLTATGLAGTFKNCGIDSPTFADRISQMVNCYVHDTSGICDLNLNNPILNIFGFIGEMRLRAMIGGAISIYLKDSNTGINIINTCTGGDIYIYGEPSYLTDGGGVTAIYTQNITKYGNKVYYDDTGGGAAGTYWPIGTAFLPVDNLADARTIMARENIIKLHVRGYPTIDANMENYEFEGEGDDDWFSGITLDVAFSVNGSIFKNITVYGDCLNSNIFCHDCFLESLINFSGLAKNCGFGDVSIAGDFTGLIDCYAKSDVTLAELTIDYAGLVRIYNWRGPLQIIAVDDVSTIVNLTVVDGAPVEIAASCTAGTINIYGSAVVVDNSAGATVNDYTQQSNRQKQLLCVDFWSEYQEEVQVAQAAGTLSMPNVTVSDIPAGATIVRAIAMVKARAVENTNGAANKLDGATVAATSQVIQVRDDTPGTWRDAINFVDDQFGLAASTREGGEVILGQVDIAVEVDGNDTYNVQWLLAKADQDVINFNDVQVGLRVWYRV